MTSIVLGTFGFTFFSLGMMYATAVAILNACIWGILYVQKRIF